MIEVEQSKLFDTWVSTLRDRSAVAMVITRIERIRMGLLGDVRSVGAGVSELRIDYGPGYRVYFTWRGKSLILLLCGGDKATQSSDIKTAKAMAAKR